MKSAQEIRFEFFYKEYYLRLKYVATKIVKNELDAEDLVQEAMIKFLNYEGEIYHEKRLLFTIIKQISLNFIDKKRELTTLYFEPLEDNDIERLLTQSGVLHLIIKISDRLPKGCKNIFDMMYIRQMDYAEIVAETGMNINTLRNQHKRMISLIQSYFNVKLVAKKRKWSPELLEKINTLCERMPIRKACSMCGVHKADYWYYKKYGNIKKR